MRLIFGSPGTGKTTKCLSIVSEWLNQGINAADIAYMSFSTRAAREPVARFSGDDDLPWFRTLHSAAFIQQGLSKASICSDRAIRKFAEDNGLDYKGNLTIYEGMDVIDSATAFDAALAIYNTARNKLVSVGDVVDEYGIMFPASDINELVELYEKWKKAEGWLDFTDVLMRVDAGDTIPVTHAIVDEAQDLTPLQWQCVDRFFAEVDELIVAGDDDQALYSWAGADVERFISLADTHESEVLPVSYRVPRTVHDLGQHIIGHCKNRKEKDYAPRDEAGSIVTADVDEIDMSKGTWLLLARSRYQLAEYIEHVESAGYGYVLSDGSGKIRDQVINAVYGWERLRKGDAISTRLAVDIYSLMLSGEGYSRGAKKALQVTVVKAVTIDDLRRDFGLLVDGVWYDVMRRIPTTDKDYMRSVLRNGDSLTKPRITISTIHGAKGAEADNVVLMTDISRKIDEAMSDDEHRVWYVGVTRTRGTLYVVPPRTSVYYTPLVDKTC